MKWKRVDFSINFGLKSSLGGECYGTNHYLVGFSRDRSAGSMGEGDAAVVQGARAQDGLRRRGGRSALSEPRSRLVLRQRRGAPRKSVPNLQRLDHRVLQ